MFQRIISLSLQRKGLVILMVMAMTVLGVWSLQDIPLDAVPDITNNQVQVVSTAPTLAPQEVEQSITYPLESVMTNIPGVVQVRSISRYGLSVITIVFEEEVEVMTARQYVREQLDLAKPMLQGLADPELMPITTGLGEIYQYVLTVDDSAAMGEVLPGQRILAEIEIGAKERYALPRFAVVKRGQEYFGFVRVGEGVEDALLKDAEEKNEHILFGEPGRHSDEQWVLDGAYYLE